MPTPPADIRAISASRTLTVWFGRYVVALSTILVSFTGFLAIAAWQGWRVAHPQPAGPALAPA